MSKPAQDNQDVEDANSLYVSRCDFPSIHIVLVRKNGAPFAAAAMPPDIAERVAADILEQVAEARAAMSDTIGRCDGHA